MTTTDWIGGSGDWGDAANWSAGVPTDSTTLANLGGTSAYTASIGVNESFSVDNLNITDANAVLDLGGTLTAAGAVDLQAGTLSAGMHGVLQASSSSASFLNQATIMAETAGGSFSVEGIVFNNAGTLDIGNLDSVFIDSPFTNAGTINVTSGGRLFFQGNLSTANLGNILVDGGQVLIFGTLDNNHQVLTVGTGTSLGTVQLNGTISGGTIVDAGNGLTSDGGALDGVKYEGTLTVASALLRVYDGLTFTGANGTGKGTFAIGGNAEVDFYGTQAIDNATVRLGSGPGAPGVVDVNSNGAPVTLTLGAGLTLDINGNGSLIGGDGTLVNQGRIVTQTASGTVFMAPGAITNTGGIIVANGEGAVSQVVAPLANDGAAEVISGILDLRNAVTGTGSIQIDRSGVLLVEQAIGAGQRVVFYRTGGALEIGTSSAFNASIAGFGSGKFLDLRDVGFGSGTTVNFAANSTGGTLTVSDGTHTAKLKLVGNFTGGTFSDKTDDIGGTIVFFNDAASATAQSRLHQFNSAIATHSADKAGSAVLHPHTLPAAAVSLLAAAHH